MAETDKTKPNPHKQFEFFIDKIRHETEEETLSARRILVEFAKVDPSQKMLVLKEGGTTHEYANPDDIITMKNGMRFTIYDIQPTPVSWITA